MAIPDFQSLMLPILRRLSERTWTTSELAAAMANEHGLSEEERRTLLPSGRQTRIANRTHWAIAYLNRGGLISRVSRGQYQISPRGKEVVAQPPERITIGYLQRFPEFAPFRSDSRRIGSKSDGSGKLTAIEPVPTVIGTPEERLELADKELREELGVTLLASIRALSPDAFEQLIIDLLVGMGYGGSRRDAAEKLGRSGDGGVDGLIREDALGLDAIYIQAKRYSEDNAIGAPTIQAFAGALLGKGATKGVFVTTSRFTPQARQAGEAYKSHRIIMLDGSELADLMIEHEIGVRTIQTIKVQKVDLEAYESEAGI